MAVPSLPAQGSPSWFSWAQGLHNEVTAGRLSDAELRAAFAGNLHRFDSSLRKWSRAIARVSSNTADAKVLCLGDSTTAGLGALDLSTVGAVQSYPTQLATRLNSSALPTARGLGIPPPVGVAITDNRWTAGTGWAKAANFGAGNQCCWGAPSAPAGTLVYQDPAVLADRFDVYYLQNLSATTLGTFTATATGGSTVTQSSIGPSATIAKVTVSAGSAATTNSLTIGYSSGGGIYIIAVEPWLSTARRVRVGNAGVAGAASGQWAAEDFANLGSTTFIKSYAPDLTVISLGINDANNNIAASAYLANIQAIVTTAQESGDVVLVSPFPSQTAATGSWPNTLTNQAAYRAQLATLDLPYADAAARIGSGDAANALGMMADLEHGNAPLYGDVAQLLWRGLLSA